MIIQESKDTCPYCGSEFSVFEEYGKWGGRCMREDCFWLPLCDSENEVRRIYNELKGIEDRLKGEVLASRCFTCVNKLRCDLVDDKTFACGGYISNAI